MPARNFRDEEGRPGLKDALFLAMDRDGLEEVSRRPQISRACEADSTTLLISLQ